MKNNKFILIFIVLLIIAAGVGVCFFFSNNNKNNSSNYSVGKLSIDEQQNNVFLYNNFVANNNQNSSNVNNNTINNENNSVKIPENSGETEQANQEVQIAIFSTKIYNKESQRQNNIAITCSKLNDVVIKNGSTFSFCNTLGPATSEKGYQEADIFDKEGNKKKGFGGGNCQVSTTLYNAALSVPDLVVTEKHEHSNKVPYIKEGKDAAVAYGSYDLKLKNNTGFDIKIKATATENNVTIALNKFF